MLSWNDAHKEARESAREYQPIPFWSWNDLLDPNELVQQIAEQDEAGIGGYFMHARGGLRTPYMQDEWMEAIRVCIEEGARRGMKAWLYDERGWPSGFAGGLVPRLGEQYQQKHLKCFIGTAKQAASLQHILGQFVVNENHRPLEPGEAPGDRQLMTIYYEVNPYYVDLMKDEVVEAFIDAAYEPYYQAFGNHFGKEIPGIFSDEPQLAFLQTAWSDILPTKFREKYGYDLLTRLPLLYVKEEGWEKLRYDFRSLEAELFENAYTRRIGQWCEEHGLQFTGHYLYEDSLRIQTLCSAGPMRHYRHMHVPGLDWLWGNIGDSPLTMLQVTSAAAQAGRKRVMSEMFGGTGWQMPLRQMRTNAEWQILWGVNLICTHLQSYSIRGARKEDWPPSVFYQNPQWPYIRQMNNDLTELCALFANGNRMADVLLIHPLKSAYIAIDAFCEAQKSNDDIDRLDRSLVETMQRLVRTGLGFHMGDEELMKETDVRDGALQVGHCRYHAAVVPPCLSLDCSTIHLLNQLISAGGCVVAFQDGLPTLVDGSPDEAGLLAQLWQRSCIIKQEADLLSVLRPAVIQRASWIEPVNQLQMAVYTYEDGEAYFVLNAGTAPESATLQFNMPVTLQRLRPSASDVFTQQALNVRLEPGASTLFFARNEALKLPAKPHLNPYLSWKAMPAENVLRCGMCSYSIENGPWSPAMRPHQARNELLKQERSLEVRLRYSFDVEELPSEDIQLAIESESYDAIQVNGHTLPLQDVGWWTDRSIRRFPMHNMLRLGNNEIIVSLHFSNSPEMTAWLRRAALYEAERNMLTYETELDALFLLGHFGVYWRDQHYAIGKWPTQVDVSALEKSGFPYFCGDLTLTRQFLLRDKERYSAITAELAELHGGCLQLSVNNTTLPVAYTLPMCYNLLPLLHSGENTIAMRLTITNANAMDCRFAQQKRDDHQPVRFAAGIGNGLKITCFDTQGNAR